MSQITDDLAELLIWPWSLGSMTFGPGWTDPVTPMKQIGIFLPFLQSG